MLPKFVSNDIISMCMFDILCINFECHDKMLIEIYISDKIYINDKMTLV